MHWQYTPYTVSVLSAAIISSILMIWAWRRRPTPGACWFTLLMFSAALWAVGYALEMNSTDLAATLLWSKVQYVGAVTISVAWLALVLSYIGQRKWLTAHHVALFFILPVITVVLAWTNGYHHLIWIDPRVESNAAFNTLAFTPGAWWWINIAYAYTLLTISTVLLVNAFARSTQLYRQQIVILLAFSLTTWLGNIVYTIGLSPQHMNLTPLTFSISGVMIAWGLFRYRILNIVPIARETIIDNVSDFVIVLDPKNRIVDLNPAAQSWIGHSLEDTIGAPVEQVLSRWPALVELVRQGETSHAETALDTETGQRIWETRIMPLRDRRGKVNGQIITGRDVTARRQHEIEIQLLMQITREISVAPSRKDAVCAVLRLVVEQTGWAFGEAWLPDEKGQALKSSEASYYRQNSLAPAIQRFDRSRHQYTFAPNVGLPGRVWASGKPEWRPDVTVLSAAAYRRVRLARIAGFRAALGVPVLAGEQVVAVLVFYMTEVRREDRRLVEVLSSVAAQLGVMLQHKQAEETLRLQAAALNTAANGIVITDRSGRLVWANPAFSHLTGYSLEEARGKNVRVLKSGRHSLEFYRNLWGTILAGRTWQGEMVNRRKDGSLYTEEMTIAPVCDRSGEITHFIAVKQDITDRKLAEQETQRQHRFLNGIIASIASPFYVINVADYSIALANSTARALGVDQTKTCYAATHRRNTPCDGGGHPCPLQIVRRSKSATVVEHTHFAADGTSALMEVHGYPILDEEGNVVQMIEYSLDITARKAAEEALEKERQKTEALLRNILPDQVAAEIKQNGRSVPVLFESASILFTDFQDFTHTAEKLSPQELVNELDYYFSAFEEIIERCGLEKLKTIGDSFMCVAGAPIPSETHATDSVRAALEIVNFVQREKAARWWDGRPYWEVRVGISSGPVVAGIVGQRKYAYDVWGDAVVMAARMETSGEIGQVNISRATYEQIKDQFACEYRGKVPAKNKGRVDMYFVHGARTGMNGQQRLPVALDDWRGYLLAKAG